MEIQVLGVLLWTKRMKIQPEHLYHVIFHQRDSLEIHVVIFLVSLFTDDWWQFSHSVISDSATTWTVAHQVSLSMGFFRQEYWSGLPFPSPVQIIQFSRSVVSDSLQPRKPQHTRPPCPSPTPRVYSNLCPLSR